MSPSIFVAEICVVGVVFVWVRRRCWVCMFVNYNCLGLGWSWLWFDCLYVCLKCCWWLGGQWGWTLGKVELKPWDNWVLARGHDDSKKKDVCFFSRLVVPKVLWETPFRWTWNATGYERPSKGFVLTNHYHSMQLFFFNAYIASETPCIARLVVSPSYTQSEHVKMSFCKCTCVFLTYLNLCLADLFLELVISSMSESLGSWRVSLSGHAPTLPRWRCARDLRIKAFAGKNKNRRWNKPPTTTLIFAHFWLDFSCYKNL